jgi:F-box protein 9
MQQNYSPYHLVDYYRYMRFYPDGSLVAMTSSDDPQSVCVDADHYPQ